MEMPEFSAIILWEVFFEKNKLIDKKMRVSEKGTLFVFFVKVRTFASSDFFICSKMYILEHVNR